MGLIALLNINLIMKTKVGHSDMYIQIQPAESNFKFSPSCSVF